MAISRTSAMSLAKRVTTPDDKKDGAKATKMKEKAHATEETTAP